MKWPSEAGHLVLEEIDSTNCEARRRAELGETGPLWIMARRQTLARGRRGRSWEAPRGNLSASCLLRPLWPAPQAALLSFAAAVSVAEYLEAAAQGARVELKWPNDALLNGRKVAGLLLESSGEGCRLDWLVVGVGLNLAHSPAVVEPDAWPPTSVAREVGGAPDPEDALAAVAGRFRHWFQVLEADGFAPLRAAWLARAASLGNPIRVRLPREEITAVFSDLDEDGALVLDLHGAARRIYAADVYF